MFGLIKKTDGSERESFIPSSSSNTQNEN